MTKFQLFSALTGDGRLTINGVAGILQGITREDGSGNKFNLLMLIGNVKKVFFVRTID
jgi:hypothetical protein